MDMCMCMDVGLGVGVGMVMVMGLGLGMSVGVGGHGILCPALQVVAKCVCLLLVAWIFVQTALMARRSIRANLRTKALDF